MAGKQKASHYPTEASNLTALHMNPDVLFYLFDLLMILFFFVFVDEINGDVEKEEKVVLNFTVHDSNV